MPKKSGLKNLPQPWMNTSKEELVECPFDKHHVILKSRLIAHICKCRQQCNGDEYATCPFNASHAILKKDLKSHVETCPDRKKADSHLFRVGYPVEDKMLENAHVEVPPAEELWDSGPSEPYSYLDGINEKISKLPILRGPVCGSRAKKKKFIEEEVTRHISINKESQPFVECKKQYEVSSSKKMNPSNEQKKGPE